MIVALAATPHILHESIATGMEGVTFPLFAIPVLSLAFVVWAVASRRLAERPRRATMVATILLACGVWALVRSDGIDTDICLARIPAHGQGCNLLENPDFDTGTQGWTYFGSSGSLGFDAPGRSRPPSPSWSG